MQVGTNEEIDKGYKTLEQTEDAFVLATLRLRALKGLALFQTGDSFSTRATERAMDSLGKEFGTRNLRMF